MDSLQAYCNQHRSMPSRYDERDTIFSRMYELIPGTQRYEEYYARRPDLLEIDTSLRSGADGVFSDRLLEQAPISGGYRFLSDLRQFAWKATTPSPSLSDTAGLMASLEQSARRFNAADFRVTRTPVEHAYAVRGRGEHYGEPNDSLLPCTIVFSVPMDSNAVQKAPAVEESVAVTESYIQVAVIGMVLSYTLRELGFRAVCHMDGESQLILPPLAEAAGLGSIGWMGVLLTRTHGPGIRLGAVSTDAPLPLDTPDTGRETRRAAVLKYCMQCGRCARLCPAGAIKPLSDSSNRSQPSIDHERCYRTWRELGTDCGVCLAVCPFGTASPSQAAAEPGDPDFLKSILYRR